MEVPDSLQENVGKLTVAVDVMFLNVIPFEGSFLRGINLKTVEFVSQWLKTVLANFIGKIFWFYKDNEYTIKTS